MKFLLGLKMPHNYVYERTKATYSIFISISSDARVRLFSQGMNGNGPR